MYLFCPGLRILGPCQEVDGLEAQVLPSAMKGLCLVMMEVLLGALLGCCLVLMEETG